MQCGHLEQLVQNDISVSVFLHIYHNAHTVAVAFVIGVAYTVELAFLHQICDVLNKLCLVDTVRNFCDNNLVVCLTAFNFSFRTHHNTSATCLVCVTHTLYSIYIRPGREVRCFYILHKPVHINVRIVYICTASVNYFAKIMRGYVGSHTHSNTVSAVHKQVGYFRRHDCRLLQRVVKVVRHVHRFLIKVVHDVFSHLRKAAFCITHGCSRITVHTTKVSLPVDKRITHVPILSHTHQCTVYRAVSVRVVLTKHLTYHARALLIRFVACVAYAHHSVQNTPVHGFESVAHIRQCTGYNDRH